MTEHPPSDQADLLALADRVRASTGAPTGDPGDPAGDPAGASIGDPAGASTGGSAAESLAARCHGRPWLGAIPAATEATVGALLEFLTRYPDGSDSALQLVPSAIEPPSAQLAFRLAFPRAEFHPQSVGEPDPRERVLPGDGTVVWRYDGMAPRPAVAPPSPAAADRVRALAVSAWPHPLAVHGRAAALADLPLTDLLGVLVHPPAPPTTDARPGERPRPDVWVRAVQVIACLAIAQHRPDQPWRGSARATVLAELFLGPEDWVTEAAGFALVASAWLDPDLRADVGATIGVRWFRAEEAAGTRPVTILGSLTELVLACPWLDPRIADRARELRARLSHLSDPEPPAPDELERLAGIARSHAPARRWFRRR